MINLTPPLLARLSPYGDSEIMTSSGNGEFEKEKIRCIVPRCGSKKLTARVRFAGGGSSGWYYCHYCKTSCNPKDLISLVLGLRAPGDAAAWHNTWRRDYGDPLRHKGLYIGPTPERKKKENRAKYEGRDDLFRSEFKEVF